MPADGSVDRLEGYLALAERLAEQARAVTRRWFAAPPPVEDKADASPVTAADREAEALMRAGIAAAHPEHGILGEEYGQERGDAEFVWVLDPIDGTKRFITGQPWFGTLISLTRQGRPILGVIDLPMLDQRWTGALGRPTLLRQGDSVGEARTRPCAGPGAAILGATSPEMFHGQDAAAYRRLRQAVKFPVFGGECLSYGLLASGRIDLVLEADLGVYDYLAQVPVIEGAGGKITDWRGRPLTLGSDGRVLAAGDPRLHAAALALLAGD
ncbi:MAG: inositol monophosphatase family protein [Kiloniellales bacterium]|nr:inositol monophosphatase family protein [Kiloniellales bacterium]